MNPFTHRFRKPIPPRSDAPNATSEATARPDVGSQERAQPKAKPVTTEHKLDDILRRLGRIEKHLIDIRDSVELAPGQPRYVIEPPQF